MRLKESPLRSFCSEEEETFTHLFSGVYIFIQIVERYTENLEVKADPTRST